MILQPYLLEPIDTAWIDIRDGNVAARDLFSRHYSRYIYADGRQPQLFVGPGEKEVLITSDLKALFVWRKFRSADHQEGINCAIFRNEGTRLSSDSFTTQMCWLINDGEATPLHLCRR